MATMWKEWQIKDRAARESSCSSFYSDSAFCDFECIKIASQHCVINWQHCPLCSHLSSHIWIEHPSIFSCCRNTAVIQLKNKCLSTESQDKNDIKRHKSVSPHSVKTRKVADILWICLTFWLVGCTERSIVAMETDTELYMLCLRVKKIVGSYHIYIYVVYIDILK